MNGGLPTYPVVDLFAGPGGLGEGFASVQGPHGELRFRSVASIEENASAYKTLLLRHFFRAFPTDEVPTEYYSYLEQGIDAEELFRAYPKQLGEAKKSALKISLCKENHKQVRKIITNRLAGQGKWALIGGPPCQAYSMAGRSRMTGNENFDKDERHFLYQEYLKIIIDHQPPVFVMENVKGLLSAKVKGESTIRRILVDLSKPGDALGGSGNGLQYRLFSLVEGESADYDADPWLFLVRAECQGVPQARHRMFILGVRTNVNVKPKALHSIDPPSVADTIGDLPRIRSGVSRTQDSFRAWRKEIGHLANMDLKTGLSEVLSGSELLKEIRFHLGSGTFPEDRSSSKYPGLSAMNHPALLSMFDPSLSVLNGHEARSHMPADLRRYMFAAVFAEKAEKSPKLSDFPVSLLPIHKNVSKAMPGGMFDDRFRVQLPDSVSKTVTSHISKDGHYYIHYDPTQCRSLTVREAARLQTFPDNFKFEGPRTEQYHQVGNAVPPYLAKQIGEIIADLLDSMNSAA